jgi:chitinase
MATFRLPSGVVQAVILLLFSLITRGFDINRNDNLAVYWGQVCGSRSYSRSLLIFRQNSYGMSHDDTANFQQRLSFYCDQDEVDIFPLAFLNVLFSTGGFPALDLSNVCSVGANEAYNGTALPDCSFLASDINNCQERGHIVTLSIGENLFALRKK